MKTKIISLLSIVIFLLVTKQAAAQEQSLRTHYVGFIPAILVEPYDTIDAVEINVIPFMYEYRFGERNDMSFQFRPIVNYRFYKPQPGISQVGATILANKYFLDMFKEDFWLKPQLGGYYTYTYNFLDKIHTMTLGIEPGVFMQFSDAFSLSVNIQPGINYYPNTYSQEFVETDTRFKFHFGVFAHAGYNF